MEPVWVAEISAALNAITASRQPDEHARMARKIGQRPKCELSMQSLSRVHILRSLHAFADPTWYLRTEMQRVQSESGSAANSGCLKAQNARLPSVAEHG